MLLYPSKPSFASGRISPRLFGRIDLDQYASALEECRNFVIFPHGGAAFRSGTYFVGPVKDHEDFVRLIPFVFSNRQANVLEFGPEYIRFYADHALVVDGSDNPIEETTPYDADDINALRYDQSGDILFLAVRGYPPKELRRLAADDWDFVDFDFLDGPYDEVNTTSTTLGLSGTSGSVTVTASAATGINDGDGFQTTDVGRLIRWEDGAGDWTWLEITARASTTEVTATIRGEDASATTATTEWRLGAWSDTTGWPEVVKFHQQRLFFGRGQAIWGSKTGDFSNFAPTQRDGTVEDDNAVTYRLAAGRIDLVRWMMSGRVLEVGTEGAEFGFSGGATGPLDAPLTPDSALARKATEVGGFLVTQPVFSDNGTVFLNRSGRKLMNFYYSFGNDDYTADDLTLLSEDFTFPGVTEMAYQAEPDMILWATRADGALLACTFNPKQEVIAWHEHILGGAYDGDSPVVESVCAIPAPGGGRDEVWVSVLRTIDGSEVRYIEYMTPTFRPTDDIDDAFFVDSGLTYDGSPETTFTGLDHLEGQEVSIIADGTVRPPQTVESGEVEIGEAASVVHVGLPYTGSMIMLPLELGGVGDALTGRRVRIRDIGILLYRSILVEVGVDGKPLEVVGLRTFADDIGEPLQPRTFFERVPVESDSDYRNRITVVQQNPLPCTVLAVLPVLDL